MNVPAQQVAQQLQSAARLLEAGDLARARALLEQILAAQPGLPDAYWLLAGVLMRAGDYVRAERAATTAARLSPGNPSAHALLGEILACQNRMEEAEAAARRALQLVPNHPQATATLARILQSLGKHNDVIRFLQQQRARGLNSSELRLLCANSFVLLRRFPEAIAEYRHVATMEPDNAAAVLGLMAGLIESGDAREGEAVARDVIRRTQGGPETVFLLSRALLAQGKFEEAERELRCTLRMQPTHSTARINLAELIWMRSGDRDAAAAVLDEALNASPGDVDLRAFKAKLIEWTGDPQDALAELERGLLLDPANGALNLSAAVTAVKCDPAKALLHAQRAVSSSPGNRPALCALASALLACGQPAEAAKVAQRMRDMNPFDGHAIVLLATSWRLLGDGRYRQLYDYERFVRASSLDVPEGWASLSAYLSDLAHVLKRRHELVAHPIGQTLRTGTQVDLSANRADDPAIRAFAQAIDGPIRRYMQAIGSGNDVLRSRNADNFKITGIWSVRLRANGHHVNHYHPEGWLSSACYIELPETLGAKDHEGWIKFGESGIPTQPPLEAEHFVKPEPGLLVLFPSWMWHGTVPFSGGEQDRRLTVAFDVVPV